MLCSVYSTYAHGGGMINEDTLTLARKAGWTVGDLVLLTRLEIFAKLVAAKEREGCAKVCDALSGEAITFSAFSAEDCAIIIRARGEE